MRQFKEPLQFHAPICFWDQCQLDSRQVVQHLSFQIYEHQLSTENAIQIRIYWPNQHLLWVDMILSLNTGNLNYPYRQKYGGDFAGVLAGNWQASRVVQALQSLRGLQLLDRYITLPLRQKLWKAKLTYIMQKWPRLYVQGIN